MWEAQLRCLQGIKPGSSVSFEIGLGVALGLGLGPDFNVSLGLGQDLLTREAVEMKPRWLYPFDPEQTSYSGQFWLADGATR